MVKGFRNKVTDVIYASSAICNVIPSVQQMAEKCRNFLDRTPDPSKDYECKFSIGPLGIPFHYPTIVPPDEHGYDPISLADTDVRMDMAYPYIREILGLKEKSAAEEGVRKRVESYRNEQGISEVNPAAFTGTPIEGKWISQWALAHNIMFYCDEFNRTKNDSFLIEARRIIDFWTGLAEKAGSMLYMPYGPVPWKNGKWLKVGWCQYYAAHYPFVIEPLVRYHEESGDEEILKTAVSFAEGILEGIQPGQGDVAINPATGEFQGHVHLHTRTIWGMAHLGAVTSDARYTLWAKKAYDFIVGKGTDFGWYPEFIPQQEFRSETCVTGDMTAIAYWLVKAGIIEEYERMEKTFRNYLRTSQFSISENFSALYRSIHKDKCEEEIRMALLQLGEIEGGFAAQVMFNDMVSFHEHIGKAGMTENGIQMMGCCPPSGMMALYYIWKALSYKDGDRVYVNMSLDAVTKHVKIRCSYETEDRMEIEALTCGHFYIRVPEWTKADEVKAYHNGREIEVSWGGTANAYIVIKNVNKGDKIIIYYPLVEFEQVFVPNSVLTNQNEIKTKWVGNNVTELEPGGKYLPLY